MGDNDILAVTAAIAKVEGRLEGIGNDIAAIKAGNLPLCAVHTQILQQIQTQLKTCRGSNGNDSEPSSTTGNGMRMDFLKGMFSLSNISPSKAVAIAKMGRDLAFAAFIVYMIWQRSSEATVLPRVHNHIERPTVSNEVGKN